MNVLLACFVSKNITRKRILVIGDFFIDPINLIEGKKTLQVFLIYYFATHKKISLFHKGKCAIIKSVRR